MAAPPVGQGPTLSSGPPLQVGCRDMEALASLVLEAEPTVRDRPQVTCVPPNSPYTLLVRDVARSIGADFVRSATGEPSELYGCVVVADLTLVRAGGKLGSNVIAISHRLDLECYEVITPEQVRGRLKRTLRNLVERDQLLNRVRGERQTIRTLNEIGLALSAQTSQADLLDTVLTQARRALFADGGSIYLVERGHLRFFCSQNDTIPFRAPHTELRIDDRSLTGFVALTGQPLNIPDTHEIPSDAPYRPQFSFDAETGYETRSLLLVPMTDRDGVVLGVLVLVNRKAISGQPITDFDRVKPFTEQQIDLAGSISSQAAVALENYRLYREIRGLFDGFVEAAVTAIEARDPTTGGHSHRVAELTRRIAAEITVSTDPPFRDLRFGEAELTELHYAAMLHDFGKVGVREQVLLKADKLFSWEMSGIEARFRLAAMQVMLESIRDNRELPGVSHRMGELKRDLSTIRRLNRPNTLTSLDDARELERISQAWELDDMGEPVLSRREASRLCIPYGSLDPDERREIESHVTHTHQFLKIIPWTRDLKRVPELAFAHHEKLDGTGYPRGLKGDEIPYGARIMTIADIFDALTAGDRPYKSSLSADTALQILRREAAAGKVEHDALELFAARRLWLGVV